MWDYMHLFNRTVYVAGARSGIAVNSSRDLAAIDQMAVSAPASMDLKSLALTQLADGMSARRRLYLSVKQKFSLAVLFSILWTAVSVHFARGWYVEFSPHVGSLVALFLIGFIAIIPGFLNAFMLASLCMDRRPGRRPLADYPGVTILIAAYNEEGGIFDTLLSIHRQAYPGPLEVIVINDGSRDRTREIVQRALIACPWLRLLDMDPNGGKANALNRALAEARYDLVVTLDADSYLYKGALQHLVERYRLDPDHTAAVAGTILIRNSRSNWITRVQEWDYFHGIAAAKRVQSMYQGTLVAQGAFSLYERDVLREVGGWPDCVGEDIVLTWAILKKNYRVGHCEDACVFTNAPDTLRQFVRQRQRWSRGMVEAFKVHPGILLRPRLSTFFIYWNLLFPLLDVAYSFGFIPGLILALFGCYWIAGPMTLLLLPMALLMNMFMFSIGSKMFDTQGLRVRRNVAGFFTYALGYSFILQPACILGYLSELLHLRKTWGTK
jgi:biofilm PGA synthesis N-glycosyltransferase PgaC